LYPTEEAAQEGIAAGGTGFLAIVPSEENPGYGYVYAITNRHVIDAPFCSPVVRINTLQGDTEIREYKQEDWIPHPDGDDIAAVQIKDIQPERLKLWAIPLREFANEDKLAEFEIGPGDEVFTVGRFITHSGLQRNLPSVRFGNISMMPEEEIADHRGHKQKLYLVEVRSLRGSSGSPVFVYLSPWIPRPSEFRGDAPEEIEEMLKSVAINMLGPWLLGIACADLPYKEEVWAKVLVGGVETEVKTDAVAYSNSGQMAVIPAWRIQDFLLNDEGFKMAREASEKKRAETKAKSPLRPTAQDQKDTGITRDGFENALRLASRKVSEPESGKKRGQG